MKDTIVEEVRSDLKQRSEDGIIKYNTTLDRNDLSHKQWLQHAYEEALDMALYLKRAMRDVDSYIKYKNLELEASILEKIHNRP